MNDKLVHAIVGLFIFLAVYITLGVIPAALIVTACALGKELYDKFHGVTGFNILDILATLAGGLVGYLITLIF